MTLRDIVAGRTKRCKCTCGKKWHRPVAAYCYNCGAKLEKGSRKK